VQKEDCNQTIEVCCLERIPETRFPVGLSIVQEQCLSRSITQSQDAFGDTSKDDIVVTTTTHPALLILFTFWSGGSCASGSSFLQ
jgi:hypothetical protein